MGKKLNYPINEEIKVDIIRLVRSNETKVMNVDSALRMAKDRNLDLILISPESNPPVCKIADYGKMRYQHKKREKENKKKQHVVNAQEIRFRPNIGDHDYQTKINKIKEFLSQSVKLKVTVMFRKRELAYPEFGAALLKRVVEDCEDMVKSAEFEEYTEGARRMTVILKS